MQLDMSAVARELLPQPPNGQPGEIELNTLFLELWPDQKDHLRTYRGKPDCSCRAHIQQAMIADTDKLQQFLNAVKRLRGTDFLKMDQAVPENLPPLAVPPKPAGVPAAAAPGAPLRHLAGQTRDIVDTPEAYTQLLRDLQKQGLRFMGLTLRPVGENRLRVYFY